MDSTVVNVAAELKRPGTAACRELEYDIKGLELLGRELVFQGPVRVHLKYVFDGDGIIADGSLEAVLVENCARCGKEFLLPFEQSFHERFIRVNAGQANESSNEDDSDSYVFSGDKLDLNDLLRDTLILNLPISSVCADDCKGLCPTCGTDLNFGACSCGDKATDGDAEDDAPEQNSVLSRLLGELYKNDKEV